MSILPEVLEAFRRIPREGLALGRDELHGQPDHRGAKRRLRKFPGVLPSALSSTAVILGSTDVSLHLEWYVPGRAISIEQWRHEISNTGSEITGIVTEGRCEFCRLCGQFSFINSDEFAAADHGTPIHEHG